MPRYALHDRVITPKQLEGEIVMVWPTGPHGKAVYSVSIDGRARAHIHTETELRAAPHIPEGKTVRCIDCRHARASVAGGSVIYCVALTRLKSKASQRLCNRYAGNGKPLQDILDRKTKGNP